MKLPDAALPPLGVQSAPVVAWRAGVAQAQPDWLAQELPVALVFNGISHAVMLASPADLEDFALGFALSEGLMAHPDELYGVEVQTVAEGVELQLEVAAACEMRLKARRRAFAGRTGCGLCGTESLAQVQRELPRVPALCVAPAALARAQGGLREHQAMQQLTGATHAAAWCLNDGTVRVVREDVGRHNALDKLIGALARAPMPVAEGFVCITSRASFEMVQKAAMLGVGVLAAVSAPTTLAVSTAQTCNLALVGFVRDDNFVAYTFAERFGLNTDETPHGR